MTLHAITEAPDRNLQKALSAFERQFVYPLGADQYFRIVHDSDYPKFSRAIGDGCCFVYEDLGAVLGTVSATIRPLLLPDGSEIRVAYICDVKMVPGARRGFVLLPLMSAVVRWCKQRAVSGFGVVMDGTAVLPPAYTGRFGIPSFCAVSHVNVLKIDTRSAGDSKVDAESFVKENDLRQTLKMLGLGSYVCPSGLPLLRSSITPQWLVQQSGNACGCLEDTVRAKQLIKTDGMPIKCAHLSSFVYKNMAAAARLIRNASSLAFAQGYPSLFVSLPAGDSAEICSLLSGVKIAIAPATIYGFGLEGPGNWFINSSEI